MSMMTGWVPEDDFAARLLLARKQAGLTVREREEAMSQPPLYDPATGRPYTVDPATSRSYWLDHPPAPPIQPRQPWPRRHPVLAGALAVLAVLGVIRVLTLATSRSGPSRPAASAAGTVVYEVTVTITNPDLIPVRSVDVTMATPSGITQRAGEGVPFSQSYTFGSGAAVVLSAQAGSGTGDVTCRITVNGLVISENTATGDYAVAMCKGAA